MTKNKMVLIACTLTLTLSGCKKHNHSLIHHDIVNPTCEEEGTIEYWSCLECGKTFSDDNGENEVTNLTISSLNGHDYRKIWYNDAYYKFACVRCGNDDLEKNIIYFGSYPQSKVSDTEIAIKGLSTTYDSSDSSWIDYGYYINDSVDSYMFYKDVDINEDGRNDYRAVYFTKYRSNEISTAASNVSYQNENGYSLDTVYWFKYEPIKWRVLKNDNNKALIISDLILDSQEFYHSIEDRTSDDTDDTTTETIYSNNYQYSNIRKWLNTNFYNVAFNSSENAIIEKSEIDNSISTTHVDTNGSNIYASDIITNDNLFLLSYAEVTNTDLFTNSYAKFTKGTDYAKSQGLCVDTDDYGDWLTRSPDPSFSFKVSSVNLVIDTFYSVITTYRGVRVACNVNL